FGDVESLADEPGADESPDPVATWLAGLGAGGPLDFSKPTTRMTARAMIAAAPRWRCGICFILARCALIRSLVRWFIEVLLMRFRATVFASPPVNSNQSASV